MAYETTIQTLGIDSVDNFIGTLSSSDVVSLLKEIQKAITLQYVTNGKVASAGTPKNIWNVVHKNGEYGAYRFTLQQMVDSGIIDGGVIDWSAKKLPSNAWQATQQEQFTPYSESYLGIKNKKITLIETETSAKSNIMFYMLTHVIKSNMNPQFAIATTPLISSTMEDFVLSEQLQDEFMLKYLEFVYQLLITSRSITDSLDKKFLAGVLSVASCFDVDAAQNYVRGNIKTDQNGIGAKYWFDVGYNSVASSIEKVGTEGPNGTSSIVADSDATIPDAATPPETSTATAPTKGPVIKNVNNAVITYEVSDKSTISAKVVSTQAPKPTIPEPISNPYEIAAEGIVIKYNLYPTGDLSVQVSDSRNGSRILSAEHSNSLSTIKANIIRKLNLEIRDEADDATKARFSAGLRLIESDFDSITNKISNVVNSVNSLQNSQTQSNQQIAFDDPADIETLLSQLNNKKSDSERAGYDFLVAACDAAISDISQNFSLDTEPLQKFIDNSTNVATDGSAASTVTTTHESGATTTVTATTNPDGTITQEKTVTPVESPLVEEKPQTLENGINHPARDGEAVNTQANAPTANSLPDNSQTNPQDTTKGFRDPNNAYPKPEYTNKPDTNTLALGVNSRHINGDPRNVSGDSPAQSLGSSPAARTASRKRSVQMAGRNGATWTQPPTPYNAAYPYNKVMGSEAGHVFEIDDTPGAERLNLAHRSGTFTETGPDGTQVNRIVGNGYSIYEKDGFILVEGNANVHVAGQCNVFIMNDTTLTMHGKVNLDVHNDVNVNIGGKLGLSVAGGIYVRNEGDISVQNKGNVDVEIQGNNTMKTNGKHQITANAGFGLTSLVDTHVKTSGKTYMHSAGDFNVCTDTGIKARAGAAIDIKAAAEITTSSGAATNVKSGAAVNVEGAGNISLKAPEVASSKFSAPTIDVSTLNAASTNLKGTDPQGGQVTPIFGSAGPVSPGSAADAADAVCAVAAKQPITYTLEPPVSASVPAPVERAEGGVSNSGGGPENDGMLNDGGDIDSNGNTDTSTNANCAPGGDGSEGSGVNGDGSDGTGTPGQISDAPGRPLPPRDCNTYKGQRLPPLPGPGGTFDGNLQLSPNFRLSQLCVGAQGCPSGWRGMVTSPHGHSKAQIINNLRCMAVNALEPIREKYPRFTWSCAYRSRHPTRGGKDPGAHGYGAAIDMQFPGYDKGQYIQIAHWIASNIPHDQVLLERRGDSVWVHLGYVYKDGSQRRMDFSMNNDHRYGPVGRFKQVWPLS